MLKRLAFMVGAVLAASPAFAQNSIVIAGPGGAPTAPGATANATVTVSSNAAGGIAGVQFRLCYDPSVLTVGSPAVAAGLAGVVCAAATDVNCPGAPTTRGVSCSGFSAGTFTLPGAVTFPFTVAANASVTSTPLVFGSPPAVGMFDGNGDPVLPVTATAGTFAVAGVTNTPPNLTYNPTTAAGVNFPAGVAGAAAATITATPSGGSGSGVAATTTLNSCVPPAGFTITNAPINFSFAGNTTAPSTIQLSCTRGATAQTGNLVCQETQGAGAAVSRTWSLSCPAAVPVSGPAIAYAPAPPGPVAFGNVTIPANSVQNIVATPSGGGGGGTTTLGACAITGSNEFALVSAATLTFTAGNNAPQNLGVRFTPALPVGNKTASLACTETVQNGATTTRTWNLTGTTVQAPAAFSANPAPPGPVTFGQVIVGQSANRTIAVTNSASAGAQNLPLTGCAVANAPGVVVSPTSLNLAPGASGNLVLTYTPGSAVALPANATLTCTDPLSFEATRTWNLTGAGVVPVTIAPGSPANGSTITLGGTAPQNATIGFANAGTAAQAVNCAVTPAGAPFVVSPVPLNVPAGGTASVTVGLGAGNPGTFNGTLTCTPAVGAPFTFTLAGTIASPVAVNAISAVGLWAMLGLMLGTGLVVVSTRKQ